MRHAKARLMGLLCAAVVISFISSADAQYIGVSIAVAAHYPTMNAVYDDPGSRIVSNAIEYPVGSYQHYNANWQIDVTANQMILTWPSTNSFFFEANFNGFVFTHAATGPFMQSASVDPASDF